VIDVHGVSVTRPAREGKDEQIIPERGEELADDPDMSGTLSDDTSDGALRDFETGTGFARAKLSEILPAACDARFVRMTDMREGDRKGGVSIDPGRDYSVNDCWGWYVTYTRWRFA
jgi:hypothetical protein